MAYDPQTDGHTEWINQEVKQYLQIYVNHLQDDWVEWLPIAEFSYNNKIQMSTGYSSFSANHGHCPNDGRITPMHFTNEAASAFAHRMKKVQEDCQAAWLKPET